jgi:flagellar protein FliS
MPYTNRAITYQKTNIESADPLKLIVMCYDAAIQDLDMARDFHQNSNMEAAYEKIRHAQDIITELLLALDYERGGEIAQNLSRLYNFTLRKLLTINSREDTSIYNHLIRILSGLRDAWEEIRQRNVQSVTTPSRPWGVSA